MSPLLFGNCPLMRGWGGTGGTCKCLLGGWVRANFVWSLLSEGEKACQDVLWGKSAPKCPKVPRKTGRGGQKLFGQHPNRRGDFDKGTSLCAFFLLFVSNLIIHVRDENSNQTRSRYACDEKPNHLPGPAGHTEMRKSN